jgi:hypothetical protein
MISCSVSHFTLYIYNHSSILNMISIKIHCVYMFLLLGASSQRPGYSIHPRITGILIIVPVPVVHQWWNSLWEFISFYMKIHWIDVVRLMVFLKIFFEKTPIFFQKYHIDHCKKFYGTIKPKNNSLKCYIMDNLYLYHENL